MFVFVAAITRRSLFTLRAGEVSLSSPANDLHQREALYGAAIQRIV